MEVLRVATFNIRHGRGLDGEVDLARTAAAIVETGAELIALQEVDRNMRRSGKTDQGVMLAQATGLQISFFPTLARGGGEYGIALAARRPLDAFVHRLPNPEEDEPRIALSFSWSGVNIIATHLATRARSRRAQTAALATLAAETPPPVLVMGDLNQGRFGLRHLLRAGFDAGRRREHTLSTRSLRWQIDYVLAGPGTELIRTWTVTTDASDHVPLGAEFVVAPRPESD